MIYIWNIIQQMLVVFVSLRFQEGVKGMAPTSFFLCQNGENIEI
jgi:hypothetical protein